MPAHRGCKARPGPAAWKAVLKASEGIAAGLSWNTFVACGSDNYIRRIDGLTGTVTTVVGGDPDRMEPSQARLP